MPPLKLNIPALLQIREGITINLALSISQSIEYDKTCYRLKEGIKKGEKREDYDEYITNTISFYFIGDQSLLYRVGEEITEEDFERISLHLDQLQYRTR